MVTPTHGQMLQNETHKALAYRNSDLLMFLPSRAGPALRLCSIIRDRPQVCRTAFTSKDCDKQHEQEEQEGTSRGAYFQPESDVLIQTLILSHLHLILSGIYRRRELSPPKVFDKHSHVSTPDAESKSEDAAK